jgi:hypothetical protein
MHLVIYNLTREVKDNPKLQDALHKFVNHYRFGAMRQTLNETLLYVAWEKYKVPAKKHYEEILEDTRNYYVQMFDRPAIQLVHDAITNPEVSFDYMDLPTC